MDHHGRRHRRVTSPEEACNDPCVPRSSSHQYDGHGVHAEYQSSRQAYWGAFSSVERSYAGGSYPSNDFERRHYSSSSYAPEPLNPPSHSPPAFDERSQPYSTSPTRLLRLESIDADSAEKVESVIATDAFDPPSAFSPREDQGHHHPTADGAHEQSRAWQHHAYAGQNHHHYFYHQQQYYSHYYADQAVPASTMYHDPNGQPHPNYSNPNWPGSGVYYSGAPPWPYGPPVYPSDASRTGEYYPPCDYGYHPYDSYRGPPPSSYPPPSAALQYNITAPGVASASVASNQSTGTPPSRTGLQPQTKEHGIKQKKPPAKKDPDKPKRPLSGYNLFFKDERERMLGEIDIPEGKSTGDGDDDDEYGSQGGGKRKSGRTDEERGGKRKKTIHGIGFKPMAQRVAAKWKKLDDETLAFYEKLAAEDYKRYKQEMKEYRDRQAKANEEDPSAPPP